MATARMPWFCPSCKKTMKKKLDNKFWRIAGHCFDCHVEMENKLRMNGKYEQYAKKKINENKKSYLKDLKQSIDEFEKTEIKENRYKNTVDYYQYYLLLSIILFLFYILLKSTFINNITSCHIDQDTFIPVKTQKVLRNKESTLQNTRQMN